MDVTMQQARGSNLRLVVEFRTAAGKPTDIDGAHSVESSNSDVALLLSQDDSTQSHEVIYELFPVAGFSRLSGFADADLGPGERMLTWSFDLNVLPEVEEAQNATVSPGQLIPKAVE